MHEPHVQWALAMRLAATKLSTIDLNLLVVFDAVMQERSVTRAGRRLGLSQSAMSHALARLRHMLKDDLFVRSPKGMVPTPRAEQLGVPVSQALDGLLHSLEPSGFDPSRSTRTFRIAVDIYSSMVLVEPMAARMRKAAPDTLIEFRPSGTLDIPALLDSGDIDLAIGFFEASAERLAHETLLRDRLVVLMRKGHPAATGGGISCSDLVTWPHLISTSAPSAVEFADRLFAQHKLSFRVGLRAPLMSTEQCLANSDLLAVVREGVAKVMVRGNRLVYSPMPVSLPEIDNRMAWHRRFSGHAAHRWLRQMTIAAARACMTSDGGTHVRRAEAA
jgi:DNA-binding transcriptional LysR family regulator